MAPTRLILLVLLADAASAAPGLPVRFEPNRGQLDPEVEFVSRSERGSLVYLTRSAAVFVGTGAAQPIRMRLEGAATPPLEGLEPLPGESHYLIGDDPACWTSGVPGFARVRARAVLPGIDLVYRAASCDRRLEYDLVVAPGASPAAARLAFEGARRLSVDSEGSLMIETGTGDPFRQRRPRAYQVVGGVEHEVAARFVVSDRRAGFRVGSYDHRLPLVIDPVLDDASYLGGSKDEISVGIAVDAAGYRYLVGTTESLDFPTAAARQPTFGGGPLDVWVAKLDPSGTNLIYSTYLGGSGNDQGFYINVDAAGAAYVVGVTDSSNFPVVNAVQSTYSGSPWDNFVTELDPSGASIVYSTYLGGNGNDNAFSVAVDAAGNAYVGGLSRSTNYPTTAGAYQRSNGGAFDVVVSKLPPAGAPLVYSTYIGGSNDDFGFELVLDPSGRATIAGNTSSTNFPVLAAVQPQLAGGKDAIAVQLDASGGALVFSTYIGGTLDDFGGNLFRDVAGDFYLSGSTASADFPLANPIQPALAGGQDAFVVKLAAAGSPILFSTYLGGSRDDFEFPARVDSRGVLWLAGWTESSDFPLVDPLQTVLGGTRDIFIAGIEPAEPELVCSNWIGGSGLDASYDAELDGADFLHLVGDTESQDFPVANGLDTTFNGGVSDAVFLRWHCGTPVGELGNRLKLTKVAANLAFRWTDVPGPSLYKVYEDVAKGGAFTAKTGAAPLGDPGLVIAMPAPPFLLYRLAGRNCCGTGTR